MRARRPAAPNGLDRGLTRHLTGRWGAPARADDHPPGGRGESGLGLFEGLGQANLFDQDTPVEILHRELIPDESTRATDRPQPAPARTPDPPVRRASVGRSL